MAKLPTFKKGDRLKHGHVNALSRGVDEANKLRRGGLHSWGHHAVGTAPWYQRLAIVVDPAVEGSDAGEITCDGQAMIRFRWFDPAIVVLEEDATEENPENDGWATITDVGEVACLDYKAAGITEPEFGTILSVWWNAQSGSWIPLLSGSRAPVRVSWTGSWEYDTNKTVSVMGSDETIKARNMQIGIGAGEGWVAFGEPDTGDVDEVPAEAFLISFDYTKVASYEYDRIQLFGHGDTGIAEWYDGTSCEPPSSSA